MNYDDLPLEVLRDLWLVRFGPVMTYDDAHNAVKNGEVHWKDVYKRLHKAGCAEMHTHPLRVVLTEEGSHAAP